MKQRLPFTNWNLMPYYAENHDYDRWGQIFALVTGFDFVVVVVVVFFFPESFYRQPVFHLN